jgi:hypothetical protein
VSVCSCLLPSRMLQVLLRKTTTVSWQVCDGSKTIGEPVFRTFYVRNGPILRVIMSFTKQPSGLDRVVSFTAAAMVIDARRFESAYVQSARRQSLSNAQLDIITSSSNDARTLQAFADEKLAGILTGKGVQVLLITSRYACLCVCVCIYTDAYKSITGSVNHYEAHCESLWGTLWITMRHCESLWGTLWITMRYTVCTRVYMCIYLSIYIYMHIRMCEHNWFCALTEGMWACVLIYLLVYLYIYIWIYVFMYKRKSLQYVIYIYIYILHT